MLCCTLGRINWMSLPPPRARAAFERPHNLGGDPTTIETARLGSGLLIAHIASVHRASVECYVGFDGLELHGWLLVAPPHFLGTTAINTDCPIGSISFPLTKRAARRSLHVLHVDVLLRNVVHCWHGGNPKRHQQHLKNKVHNNICRRFVQTSLNCI